MTEIRRTSYLTTLRRFVGAPAITVVTGLRRVGKSVLLRQLADDLRDSGQVIYVDKESLEFESISSASSLVSYVRTVAPLSSPRYVIVDEVQQIDGWERAVASLNGEDGVHVVISGSNASLLSGDLATRIAGRYLTLQVFPLTLPEYRELHHARFGSELRDSGLFELYLRTGGLPGVLHTDMSDLVVHQMLRDIFSTIALRDVIARHQIRQVSLFQAVALFGMDNVGSLVSAKRIADYLKSQRRSASVDTVLNYLAHLEEAFLFNRVDRYDIKGKRRFEVNSKYYLGDVGLRNGMLGYRESDVSGVLENLVYLELRRRGFSLSVGIVGNREIDFVAERESLLWYIQVSYRLDSRETIDRELSGFTSINDGYPRVLLTMDALQPRDFNGVHHRSVIDFLLGADLPGG